MQSLALGPLQDEQAGEQLAVSEEGGVIPTAGTRWSRCQSIGVMGMARDSGRSVEPRWKGGGWAGKRYTLELTLCLLGECTGCSREGKLR